MAYLKVRQLVLETGERLPILVDSRNGIPLFEPLSYSLNYLRMPGQAANTIEQFCRVMALFCYWLESTGIRLDERFRQGVILEQSEIAELNTLYRKPSADFFAACARRSSHPNLNSSPSFEKVRMLRPRTDATREVSPQTAVIRLHYTREYVLALARETLLRVSIPESTREALRHATALTERQFRAMAPVIPISSDSPAPKGLPESQLELLYAIIHPDSEANPWHNTFVRERNFLIITTLHALGVRGGELLKLKTTDLMPGKALLQITRSADDPEDPRLFPPQAKTRARDLGISDDLSQRLMHFITFQRRKIPAAMRRHPFIFTAIDGKPLSLNSLYKIFRTLRNAHPELDENLTAHLLRYTASSEFMEQLEQSNVDVEKHGDELRYVMGWSEKSKMPFKYARRHIVNKANEALLERQRTLGKGGKYGK